MDVDPFDGKRPLKIVTQLWVKAAAVDIRIEPIACGEREWETKQGRPILDIARREGVMIAAATE